MKDPYLDSVLEAIASAALDTGRSHLISVDELRAAGTLDVPPEWRKSLGARRTKPVERNLFSDLDEAEETTAEDQEPIEEGQDEDAEADDEV